jgi:hypothetical protein
MNFKEETSHFLKDFDESTSNRTINKKNKRKGDKFDSNKRRKILIDQTPTNENLIQKIIENKKNLQNLNEIYFNIVNLNLFPTTLVNSDENSKKFLNFIFSTLSLQVGKEDEDKIEIDGKINEFFESETFKEEKLKSYFTKFEIFNSIFLDSIINDIKVFSLKNYGFEAENNKKSEFSIQNILLDGFINKLFNEEIKVDGNLDSFSEIYPKLQSYGFKHDKHVCDNEDILYIHESKRNEKNYPFFNFDFFKIVLSLKSIIKNFINKYGNYLNQEEMNKFQVFGSTINSNEIYIFKMKADVWVNELEIIRGYKFFFVDHFKIESKKEYLRFLLYILNGVNGIKNQKKKVEQLLKKEDVSSQSVIKLKILP